MTCVFKVFILIFMGKSTLQKPIRRKTRFVPQGIAGQNVLTGLGVWKPFECEHIMPIKPVPKPRMTRFDFWKPAAVRYFRYADRLRDLAPSVQWDPLNIRFIIQMPKSWSISKKNRI